MHFSRRGQGMPNRGQRMRRISHTHKNTSHPPNIKPSPPIRSLLSIHLKLTNSGCSKTNFTITQSKYFMLDEWEVYRLWAGIGSFDSTNGHFIHVVPVIGTGVFIYLSISIMQKFSLTSPRGPDIWTGEPIVDYRWTSWVWEVTSLGSRLQKISDNFRRIYGISLKLVK